MRRIALAACMACAAAWAQTGETLAGKTLTVPGDSGLKWVDTGIDVMAGDIVKLPATVTVILPPAPRMR